MTRVIFLAPVLIIMSGCSYFEKAPAGFDPWYPAVNENGDPVFAVFEGRIPCVEIPDCNKIKVGLALYRNRETRAPTMYKLGRIFVGKGNDRAINEGAWTVTHGTKLDPQAVVYQLDASAPQEFRSYWVIGEGILFILDQNLSPRVGDASWSYVLNGIKRVENPP